jgi:hypothetical protein
MFILVSAELTNHIEARITDFLKDTFYSFETREVVALIHALPLVMDWGGSIAIRPTGEIIIVKWDNPQETLKVTDPTLQANALHQGSLKYPELKSIVPVRLPEAQDCTQCSGTGIHPITQYPGCERVVCACGGLGWIILRNTTTSGS